MLIYISGPLQGSTDLDAARRLYDDLADIVRSCGHQAYVPHHHTDPTQAADLSSEDVFATDLAALNAAHAVVAHIGLPSTGVGAELALSVSSDRRVLGIKRPNERGSRFAEGLIVDAGGQVVIFSHLDDLASQLRAWLGMPAAWFGRPRGIPQQRRRVVA